MINSRTLLMASVDLTDSIENNENNQEALETLEVNIEDEEDSFTDVFCVGIALFFLILTFPVSIFFCVKVVHDYEQAVIFRLGKLKSNKGPGVTFVIPFTDRFYKLDLRIISFNVPSQEIFSKDSVNVEVDAVVYYKILDATKAIRKVADYDRSIRLLAVSLLRGMIGVKNLAEIVGEREEISKSIQSALDEACQIFGVKVERVELRNVLLPLEFQKIIASEAEALRKAKAKQITAEGEEKAAHILLKASRVLSESSAAMQLHYLQTLETIAETNTSTIVFPFPIEFLGSMQRKHGMKNTVEAVQIRSTYAIKVREVFEDDVSETVEKTCP